MLARILVVLGVVTIAGCASPPPSDRDPEAVSLLGQPLYPMAMTDETRADREAKLDDARRAYAADPEDENAIIWLGRRTAYLGRYRDAVAIFTQGLETHPRSHKLRRHRGHRYITLRRLDDAVEDLSAAARLIKGVDDEVEPDGLPNARNMPTSSSHTNIYYHLGLAHYLQGDFEASAEAYRRCAGFSRNPDMLCAATYWLYLSLRRLDQHDVARRVLTPITADLDVIENHGYHQLLLLFKGDLTIDEVTGGEAPPVGRAIEDATVAYGVAMWRVLDGNAEKPAKLFQEIIAGDAWPAFGFIAAEAELARRDW
ncbi:MAG: tetratricopeptide repeat protein [Planctomycetota bacterium]|jgi:tetratricopeptide (TPR) repeat protein